MSLTYEEACAQFDDMIDDLTTPVEIFGYQYSASRALRLLDPIMYRMEFLNWADIEGIDTDDLAGYDRLDEN